MSIYLDRPEPKSLPPHLLLVSTMRPHDESNACRHSKHASNRAGAQAWPTHPVRLIVPSQPQPTDVIARMSANGSQKHGGQQVLIENRPGGGTWPLEPAPIEAGAVHVPARPLAEEFKKEVLSFPASKHDDQIDALSQALQRAFAPGPPRVQFGRY